MENLCFTSNYVLVFRTLWLYWCSFVCSIESPLRRVPCWSGMVVFEHIVWLQYRRCSLWYGQCSICSWPSFAFVLKLMILEIVMLVSELNFLDFFWQLRICSHFWWIGLRSFLNSNLGICFLLERAMQVS